MTIHEFWLRGYRSIFDLQLQPGPLTVIVGENGRGKTNLYRSLFLLAEAAQGRLARSLAVEGGVA